MWVKGWRERAWGQLGQPWDLVVVGGGITGAGILRESARLGLRVLLVEACDFAWGTSSRSAKLVHGGLRYLRERKVRLTRASVHERERLLQDGPGLIDPMGFLLATYKGDRPGRWTYSAGLSVYDLLALQWSHQRYTPQDFQMLAPHISQEGLVGGFRYGDAQTDDARLVLRIIREAVKDGGLALNYVVAEDLLRDKRGHGTQVAGVRLRDVPSGRTTDVFAKVIVNATGAWADDLRSQLGAPRRIRPLRGSHLVFPSWRLPVAQAVSFLHPIDRRPVFIFPWEGITLVGTTDVDHDQPLDKEPRIEPAEVAYLMAAVHAQFPSLEVSLDDIVSTFAGVRPVIGTGEVDPSKESRDHVVWEEDGMLTVTGGKLTTFRLIALDALKAVRYRLPHLPPLDDSVPVLDPIDVELPTDPPLEERVRRRLLGRYAADAPLLVAAAQSGELAEIPGTQSLWAELRWASRAEGVVRLDDLMLRRVRLGHLLPGGAQGLLQRIRGICQPELGWSDARWESEQAAYLDLWRCCYSVPDRTTIPDWREQVAAVRASKALPSDAQRQNAAMWVAFVAGCVGLISLLAAMHLMRRRKESGRKLNRRSSEEV
jgi:glycerol-3-phosphate dehydrogenase